MILPFAKHMPVQMGDLYRGMRMRKVKWRWVLGLLIVVLAVGCGVKEQESVPEQTPDPTPTPITGLKEELPRKDAADQAEYNEMNRMLSRDIAKNHQSLFCIDADTGVIYFVNQNKDFYIYRLKDGEAELAVAMPASELYTYGGSVYFMVKSYGQYQMKDIKDGDIYCYTPKDGTVAPVYAAGKKAEEENAADCRLWVDENGVYFCYRRAEATDAGLSHYYLPFGAEQPVEDPRWMAARPGWGDYFLAMFFLPEENPTSRASLRLISRTEMSEDVKELSIGKPWNYCVMGDKLYYLPADSDITRLSVLDLLTGVQEDYSIWEELKRIFYYVSTRTERSGHSEEDEILSDEELTKICEELDGTMIANCFTATEQYFWIVIKGNRLIRIDRETKETAYFYVDSAISVLYTDGEQLYGMCAPMSGRVASMARILVDEQLYDEFYGWEYITIEYLTD